MALPKVLQHIINSTVHITAAERTSWNAKPTITDVNNAIATKKKQSGHQTFSVYTDSPTVAKVVEISIPTGITGINS